jgi:Rieske Fe-S protein
MGADLFSPSRLKPLAAAKELLSENLNVLKRFVGDRVKVEKIDSMDAVQRGEGRIVQFHGTACAVYRDDQNRLHCLSPVCTHAGCFVQWNNVESTWDCPCHGGRYSATGQRLYGPPSADLKRISPTS